MYYRIIYLVIEKVIDANMQIENLADARVIVKKQVREPVDGPVSIPVRDRILMNARNWVRKKV